MNNSLVFNTDPDDMSFDSNENAWKYYGYKYDYFNIEENNGEYYARIDKDGLLIGSLQISGECAYNFGGRFDRFKEIIKKEIKKDEREGLLELLGKCQVMHHSLPNIMVLPMNGGLNNLKGKLYCKGEEIKVYKGGGVPLQKLDRPDSLISCIDAFYKMHKENMPMTIKEAGNYFSNCIFTEAISRGDNFIVLYNLLKQIGSAEKFCDLFYQINQEMHTEMSEKGKEKITGENIADYLNGAMDFWKKQIGKIREIAEKNDLTLTVTGDIAKEICQEAGLFVIEEMNTKFTMK